MIKQVLCFGVVLLIQAAWGANILYLALTTSPSHTIWDKTLAMALRKNHHITFVSHGPEIKEENITSIIFEGVYEKMEETLDLEEFFDTRAFPQCDFFLFWCSVQSVFDAETKGLQTLLKQIEDGAKYDLVIWDFSTGHFIYPIIEKLNYPPLIVTSPFGVSPFYIDAFGHDLNTAYIPLWMMSYTEQMTFSQRVHNYVTAMYCFIKRNYWYIPKETKIAKKVFKENIPSFDKIEKHISIVLMNSNPILDYSRPLPPAVINVGGLHIKRVEELPKDLKSIMDNAKDGIILFSLGTNLRSADFDTEKKDAIIKAFSKLKQTVLWKFESEINNLPQNVIVREWLPQNEILAHPNIKLFITHSGSLSTYEAVYHGVPVVGMPFFADQFVYLKKILIRKIGLGLDHQNLTEDIIYNTVNEVLNNPMYRENMKLLSSKFRDQPQDPLDKAVFWVEYTLRHGGAQHLRIAARDMSYIQLYFLDFWALVIISLLIIVFITIRLCRGKQEHFYKGETDKRKVKSH